ARLELIPGSAATAITAACDPARFDVEEIGRAAVMAATPVVPLVDALRREVGGEAAGFVHYGATSQDVLDTAMMLIAREPLDLMLVDLSALASECAALAHRHRDTQMAGRTLLQQARPISFGFKAAMWLMGVVEARRRLAAIRSGGLAVQLGGPVGTLDSFGPRAAELMTCLARELELVDPGFPGTLHAAGSPSWARLCPSPPVPAPRSLSTCHFWPRPRSARWPRQPGAGRRRCPTSG